LGQRNDVTLRVVLRALRSSVSASPRMMSPSNTATPSMTS
jgi:hypothetical protein